MNEIRNACAKPLATGLDGGFAVKLPPSDKSAQQGIQGALDSYVVHQLAAEEALPE